MSNIIKRDVTSYEDYLPIQYKDSENLKKLLGIFLAQTQELEDANVDLDTVSTDINLAYGYQLDIIGKLVGAERRGKTDEEFREEILFRISINTGNGTPEDCIQYLNFVTKADDVKFWEHYPASVIMETNGTLIPSNIPNTLDNVTLAGVSVGGVIASETGQVFRGCESIDAYTNFEDTSSPYPQLEVGGDDMEMGSPLAELSGSSFTGFLYTRDSDNLSRCVLPEIDEIYIIVDNGAGEEIMLCGEEEAVCAAESLPLTTKGVFAEVYVKI